MLTSGGIIPYRRLTNPLILPVSTASTLFMVPADAIPTESTSFRVTNPNNFWVRLRGETDPAKASALTINSTQGWLFPPGFSGTFTTQFPASMATISVSMQGLPAGSGTLEISYGIGGGGESASITSSGGGASVPTGTAGSPNTSVLTVQGISGAIAQPVTVGNFPSTQPVSLATLPALAAGTNLIGSVQTRGTGTMVTGQVAMSAQNTAYQVAAARANRRSITFVPTSQFTYFYGNTGVTTTTGACAVNGAAITLETTAAVFVVSSSTGTMTFVEHF